MKSSPTPYPARKVGGRTQFRLRGQRHLVRRV